MIPIPDTVITLFNTLDSNQPKITNFIDIHEYIIGYVEIPGVGDNSDEGEVELSGVDAGL